MATRNSLIDRIINPNSTTFLRALRRDVSWSDAVSVQCQDDSNQPDPETESRNAFIYRRLGHLTVNPNKVGASEAITNSYVWSKDKRKGIVNSSEDAAKDFIKRLIVAAENARDIYKHSRMPDPTAAEHQATRMFVLHGERGMGKTFFLNYLLSRFSEEFDEKKAVWVRLNLVANFGPHNNLSNWIAAQATKVLIRYYDKNQITRKSGYEPPIPLDFIAHLKNFVDKKYADNTDNCLKMRDKVILLEEVFRDIHYEKPISEDLVPPILGNEMMRYAREMGYSFIVVLDGLDRLDITRSAKDKFDSLCRQVDEIGRAYENPGYALLVVSRTKTLKSTNSCFSDPYRQQSQRCMTIGSVDLKDIVSRRLKVIQIEVQRIGTIYHWDLGDWPFHISEFETRLSQDTEEYKTFLSGLLDSLGEDRRAQMQMVQLDYWDYLSSKRNERAYALIEYLTKAGKRYPPRYYTYRKDSGGNWGHTGSDEPTPFDSKFFPVIFCFPRVYEGAIDNPPHPQSMLIGLRIVQLLKAYSELMADGERKILDPMAAHELASICEKVFGYSTSIVCLILEELAEFGFVSLDGGMYPLPVRADQYQIDVCPKLHFMIDKVIYDIAYLNLAAMRTPVAHDVLTTENNEFVYFIANSLDDKRHHFNKENVISNWIFSKIINSIDLYRLIHHENELQRMAYENKINSLKGRELIFFEKALQGVGHRKIGMFDIAEEMKRCIVEQINAMLNSYEKERSRDSLIKLEKKISEHFTKWDRQTYEKSFKLRDAIK